MQRERLQYSPNAAFVISMPMLRGLLRSASDRTTCTTHSKEIFTFVNVIIVNILSVMPVYSDILTYLTNPTFLYVMLVAFFWTKPLYSGKDLPISLTGAS